MHMEDKLWQLFCETGDIRLYLMYREEYSKELMPQTEEEDEEFDDILKMLNIGKIKYTAIIFNFKKLLLKLYHNIAKCLYLLCGIKHFLFNVLLTVIVKLLRKL